MEKTEVGICVAIIFICTVIGLLGGMGIAHATIRSVPVSQCVVEVCPDACSTCFEQLNEIDERVAQVNKIKYCLEGENWRLEICSGGE